MKIVIFLTILVSLNASASDRISLARNLNDRALESLTYLIKNLHLCSRYHERINQEAFYPARKKLLSLSPLLRRNQKNSFSVALKEVEMLNSLLRANHGKLMRAFEAAPRYPSCLPTIPNQKNSTKPSLTYQSFRRTLEALELALISIIEEKSKGREPALSPL